MDERDDIEPLGLSEGPAQGGLAGDESEGPPDNWPDEPAGDDDEG
jgi:hypothetical protein